MEWPEAKKEGENERTGEGRVGGKRASAGRWSLFSGERGGKADERAFFRMKSGV